MDKEEGEEDEEEVQRRAFLFLNPDGERPTPAALPALLPVSPLTKRSLQTSWTMRTSRVC